MKKSPIPLPCAALAVCVAFGWNARQADAEKSMPEQFAVKYVKGESADPKDVAFKETVEQAGCTICHANTKGKGLNTYGRELSKFVRKRDLKNKEKVSAAFDEVAAVKSDRNDPNSPTFGELIQQGKLPSR